MPVFSEEVCPFYEYMRIHLHEGNLAVLIRSKLLPEREVKSSICIRLNQAECLLKAIRAALRGKRHFGSGAKEDIRRLRIFISCRSVLERASISGL